MNRIVIEQLRAEAFAPFGEALTAPDSAGRLPPTGVIADPRTGAVVGAALLRLAAAAPPLRIAAVERHPWSGQLFCVVAGPVLAVVLPDGPRSPAARAFRADAGQAFAYRPGIWHAGLIGLAPALVLSVLSRAGGDDDVEQAALEHPLEATA